MISTLIGQHTHGYGNCKTSLCSTCSWIEKHLRVMNPRNAYGCLGSTDQMAGSSVPSTQEQKPSILRSLASV